jgi:two-component system OmpR family response regulator
VVARVHAVLRRTMPDCTSSGGVLQVADLSLDHHSHEVRRGDRDIRLSATEFTLLRYLMLNHHIVVSKAEILNAVWNYDFGGQSNIVELYVGYLRRKLDHTEPKLIHTVRGAGYVIRAPLPGPHGCPASPSPLYRAREANGDVGL